MTVCEDRIYGGPWFWCASCGFAGNACELVAASPGSGCHSLTEAAQWIAEKTRDTAAVTLSDAETIEDELEARGSRRHEALAFWEACSTRAQVDSDQAMILRGKFGIRGSRVDPSFDAKRARVIGYANRSDFDAVFRPAIEDVSDDVDKRKKPRSDRVFRGNGWTDLMVVKFQDLPGRICGFLLVGRAGKYPEDYAYYRVIPSAKSVDSPRNEAGLAMLDLALTAPSEAAILAVADLETAIRLQLSHLAEHDKPLPVVATCELANARTRTVWTNLPRRRVIYTGGPLEVLMAQARGANASVSEALVWPGATSTRIAYNKTRSEAKTWQAALEATSSKLDVEAASRLINRLDLTHGEVVEFIAGCAPATKARLARLAEAVDQQRTIYALGKTIRESVQGWHRIMANGREELITDAPFRLDRVVLMPTTKRSVYQGRITFRGTETPFAAPSTEFEPDPFRWIARHLQAAGVGVATSNMALSRHALLISQLFHSPAHATGLDRVGWDHARNALVLPKYVQEADGEVVRDSTITMPGTVPAAAFDPPDVLTAYEIAALGADSPAAAVVWAVAAYVASQAIAPALGIPVCNLALVGDNAITAGTAAALACGCLEAASAEQSQHAWPVIWQSPRGKTARMTAAAMITTAPSLIANATRATADLAALTGGWATLECRPGGVLSAPALTAAGSILTHYLRDHFARRAHFDNRAILDDMHDWFGALGGNQASLNQAKTILRWDDAQGYAAAFAGVVCAALVAGLGTVFRDDVHDVPDDALRAVIVRADRTVLIRNGVIDASFAASRAMAPDRELIEARLAEAGVLVTRNTVGGWLVRGDWWSDAYSNYFGRRASLGVAKND